MKTINLVGTTDALGDVTITSSEPLTGFVEKIVMDYDDGDTGADLTFTANNNGIDEALTTVTNAGTADAVWYPRTLANKVADASAFTDVAEKIFVNYATFKVVVAQGGNAKNFKFVIVLSNEN